jgi:hypothetical protein
MSPYLDDLLSFNNDQPGFSLEEIEARERRRASARSGAGWGSTPFRHAITWASETLQHLTNIGIPFIFLTNSGDTHESKRTEKLSQLVNVPLPEDQFIQSHTPIKGIIHGHRNEHVLVRWDGNDY